MVGLQSEMRTFLPLRGGAGPGGVAHHVLRAAIKAVMLLLSSPVFCSSLYAMLQELKFD